MATIPIFLPGKSHGLRNLAATDHEVAKSLAQLSTHTHKHVYRGGCNGFWMHWRTDRGPSKGI